MVVNQARPDKKPSGARYKKQFVRRQHEIGREPALTKVDSPRKKTVRTLGGNTKHKALSNNVINVVDKQGKTVKTKILAVKDNPANRHYTRRNIMTKGTVVNTEKGEAVITNRPGQTGMLQGKLV